MVKLAYVVPELMEVDLAPENAICNYSLKYPGEENPPASRRGYTEDYDYNRYGKSTTHIWK